MVTRIEVEFATANKFGFSVDCRSFVILVDQTYFRVDFATHADGWEMLEKIKKEVDAALA